MIGSKKMRSAMHNSLPLLLIAMLMGCGKDQRVQIPFEADSWKSGSHEVRGKITNDLIERKLLIGKSKEQVISILGRPDQEEEGEFISYFIYIDNPLELPRMVHVALNAKTHLVESVWISD